MEEEKTTTDNIAETINMDASDRTVDAVPLNANNAAELIVEMYAGAEPFRRRDIVEHVVAEWKARGGLDPTSDPVGVIADATKQLKRAGRAHNRDGAPMWQVYRSNFSEEPLGETSLYAYWYPTYETLAKLESKNHWRIKIGFTQGDVESRVRSQLGTATAEMPEILTLCKENGDAWERILHGCLSLSNRHASGDGVGTEWFVTNPDEIRKIIEFVQNLDLSES